MARPRKLVHGVGVFDLSGRQTDEPLFATWRGMLQRCYTEGSLLKNPTYGGCSVCQEWLVFSNFKKWVESQTSFKTKEIDKDLLATGCKVYSPETCAMVDKRINRFIVNCSSKQGELPLGVHRENKTGLYRGSYRDPFNKKILKSKRTSDVYEAHSFWCKGKYDVALELLTLPLQDERVYKRLADIAEMLRDSLQSKSEVKSLTGGN